MPSHYLRIAGADAATSRAVRRSLADLRAQMKLTEAFSADVVADARAAAARDLTAEPGREDRRDVPFATVDPPGSMDLDQAFHLSRTADGFLVRYAIADVAAFVDPGGPVDAESHERGTTLYGPDGRIPLHPAELSEGAASLLPDADRPAVLWELTLDARGELTTTRVRRAVVRSVARLSYDEAQALVDAGAGAGSGAGAGAGAGSGATDGVPDGVPDGVLASVRLLREIGTLRQQRERARGGVSLDVPEQVVTEEPDGSVTLELRTTLPVEGWNAQLSLLTGIAAARLMREGGVGILRTLPPADPRDVARLRRTARALGIRWSEDTPYGELLPTLDASRPRDAAFLTEATSLFRGASYVAFGGTDLPQGVPTGAPVAHAAIAAEYAHVTAPLRRLVDRYGTEACLAVSAGSDVPGWVTGSLAALPKIMARTGQRAGSYEKACLDTVEAALVEGRVGEELDGVVVDVSEPRTPGSGGSDGTSASGAHADADPATQRGQVMIAEPALRAPLTGYELPLGEAVRVRLVTASIADRAIAFELAEPRRVSTSREGTRA